MKYYGYVTSKEFGGMVIPVPAQNSCLREFVASRSGQYVLPTLESHFDNCFHQLFGLVRIIEKNSAIVMYSISLLPVGEKLSLFLQKCTDKNLTLCFVLENQEDHPSYESIFREISNQRICAQTMAIGDFLGLKS